MTEMNSKRTPNYSHCNGDPEVSAAAKYTHCNGNPAEASTSDLGVLDEPVAWQGCDPDEPYDPLKCAIWAALVPFQQELLRTGGVTFMGLRNAIVEAVRSFAIASQRDALAPAAPRTGSGVSVDEIAEALWDDYRANQGSITISVTRWQALAEDSPAKTRHRRQASAILALFAQAPRDGGETQGGPAATKTEQEPNAAVTAEIERGLARCSDPVRYAIRKEASDLIGLHAPGNRHLEQAVIAALLRRTAQSQKGTAR